MLLGGSYEAFPFESMSSSLNDSFSPYGNRMEGKVTGFNSH